MLIIREFVISFHFIKNEAMYDDLSINQILREV